jgi:hypothetical protein
LLVYRDGQHHHHHHQESQKQTYPQQHYQLVVYLSQARLQHVEQQTLPHNYRQGASVQQMDEGCYCYCCCWQLQLQRLQAPDPSAPSHQVEASNCFQTLLVLGI